MTEYEDSPVIRFRLGDGVDRLGFLGIGEIKELRRLTGAGPVKLARIMADDPDPEHIADVVRLGLIGGGMEPKEALGLATYYCQPPRPMEDAWVVAMALLQAWWRGIPKAARKSSGKPLDDVDVSLWEAEAAKVGVGIEALHAMSVGEWVELRRHFTENGDKPDAPDADTVAAIKRASGQSGSPSAMKT